MREGAIILESSPNLPWERVQSLWKVLLTCHEGRCNHSGKFSLPAMRACAIIMESSPYHAWRRVQSLWKVLLTCHEAGAIILERFSLPAMRAGAIIMESSPYLPWGRVQSWKWGGRVAGSKARLNLNTMPLLKQLQLYTYNTSKVVNYIE